MKISPPMVPRFREAPITATARGLKKVFKKLTAAMASRCSNRSIASRVNVVGNVTCQLSCLGTDFDGKA